MNFFTEQKFLMTSECIEPLKDDPNLYKMLVSLGGDDFAKEGTYLTSQYGTEIEYLPWMKGTPVIGGTEYNCLTLVLILLKEEGNSVSIERAEVKDEVCYRPPGHCTLCSINDPVHTATVRGLCHETIFDTEYYYNIDESGDIMFWGKEESITKFDSRKQRWIWTD